MAKRRSDGWVPRQHGAWAMLVLPYITGLVVAAADRPLGWGDAALGLTWLAGYFSFNAATLTLKASAKRRRRYRPALITYGSASATAGLVTLWLKGWTLLAWVPVYAVLLGTALWLAGTRRERSLASGISTVLASCGLMGVLATVPFHGWPSAGAWTTMLLVTVYLIGTVLHVKALIRERGEVRATQRSLLFHGLVTVCAVTAAMLGWAYWPWSVFAAGLTLRAWWLTRAQRTARLIGVVEIVVSASALVLILGAGWP